MHVRVGWRLRLSGHLTAAGGSCWCERLRWVGAWPPCSLSAGTRRARERAPTSGTPGGNNGDAPQCDSRRQEQTQTQELSILPLRQTCRGLRIWRRNRLSVSLRFINKMSRKVMHLLTGLLFVNSPRGSRSERHSVVGRETGIF